MKIQAALDYPEAWLCLCGNTPSAHGFYPCDSEGEYVEPTPAEWTTNCYVCDRCGRIIDQATLEVVGVRFDNTLTLAERQAIFANRLHATDTVDEVTRAAERVKAVVKAVETKKTNHYWYPYPKLGGYFKLVEGVLHHTPRHGGVIPCDDGDCKDEGYENIVRTDEIEAIKAHDKRFYQALKAIEKELETKD